MTQQTEKRSILLENATDKETSAEQQLQTYKRIFESIHDGAVVADEKGYITHFNQAYGKFLGIDPHYPIGRHCTEVIENTRLHIVAKTGKAEINRTQKILGQEMMVQRSMTYPILVDGKIVRSFTDRLSFKDVKEVRLEAGQYGDFPLLESKVKLYEKELIDLRSTRYTMDSIVGTSDAMHDRQTRSAQSRRQSVPGVDHQGKVAPERSFSPRPFTMPVPASFIH